MKVRNILIFLGTFTMIGCMFSGSDSKNETVDDTFYSDLGGFGRARIPLVKPYELKKVSSNEWRLELENPELLTLSIHNVQGVDVRDSIIFIYSEGGTEFLNQQHQKAWFLIEPTLGNETGFSEVEKFKSEIGKKYKELRVRFHSPDSLYSRFEENRKITW